jgi:hypothetical protein
MAKERIEMADFIKAVQTSDTLKEVAQKTGLKEGSIQARASNYRKAGIPLKRFPRGGGVSLDVTLAHTILAELEGCSVNDIQKLAKSEAAKREAKTNSKGE